MSSASWQLDLIPTEGLMAKKIERFENFIAWQKARKLITEIYRVTSEGDSARDYRLKLERLSLISHLSSL